MSVNPFEDNSVQSTLIIPLWGRATQSKLNPNILNDHLSSKILEKLIKDYNFDISSIENYYVNKKEYFGLIFCARSRNFENALKNYLKIHPNATVVNLGCGLDTMFFRVDNGSIKWYGIDFPDVIEIRKKYIPENPRLNNIAKSVLDYSWFDDIDFKSEDGIFLIAGGLFMYFSQSDVISLFNTMQERFPGGEIIFDAPSKFGLKISNRKVRKEGKTEMLWHFYLNNPKKQISKWSKNLKIIEFYRYWSKTPRNRNWAKITLKLMKISDFLKLAYIIHVGFL